MEVSLQKMFLIVVHKQNQSIFKEAMEAKKCQKLFLKIASSVFNYIENQAHFTRDNKLIDPIITRIFNRSGFP